MLIHILSRNASLYSTQRLVDASAKRGHEVLVRDPLAFTVQVEDPPSLLYNSKPIDVPRAVIPRIGASITMYGLAVVRQLDEMNVFTLNDANSIAASRDKLRALQILSRHRIRLPKTVFVRKKREILKAIEEVGGAPVVIKLLEGAQGAGVVLAQDLGTAQAIIELLHVARQNILVQKFVEEARGRDIRAFVIGDRVVAAMRRKAGKAYEFRSNVHRGGKAEPVELTAEYTDFAVRATRLLGLRVAGVDMLEGNDGPYLIEVNSSPGLEAIEQTSGLDIAQEIIQYIESETR